MINFPTTTFRTELSEELDNILQYWLKFSPDGENGGFVGKRNHANLVDVSATKGIILNARLLWSFSAIVNHQKNDDALSSAKRAFDYLQEKFQDHKNQGVYWELDAKGNPINKRKQIYAHAFTIYALSEYYILSKDENAINWAHSLFQLIEKHAYDLQKEGYIEAFDEDWQVVEDMRLSEKDVNASKTMNTHLHILEAYTTLYRVTADSKVKAALENLIHLFLNKFYNTENNHFKLFFNDDWEHLDQKISYGHDIEAFWLLIEAAQATKNPTLVESIKSLAQPIATTFLKEAYTPHGGVINEKDLATNHTDKDRHWWPQAEAMVGLYYAYEITKKVEYLTALTDIWKYIKDHMIDHKNGEWFFRVDQNNKPYPQEDKVGMWKCPYHNSRACLVLIKKML